MVLQLSFKVKFLPQVAFNGTIKKKKKNLPNNILFQQNNIWLMGQI